MKSLQLKAGIVSLLVFTVFMLVWHIATLPTKTASVNVSGMTAEQIEYQKMMGKDVGSQKTTGFPTPAQMLTTFAHQLSDPFYDNGPNDKGIAIQLGHSLVRVALGFLLACVVAVPFGFVIGMSPLLYKACDPFIQILKPISHWLGCPWRSTPLRIPLSRAYLLSSFARYGRCCSTPPLAWPRSSANGSMSRLP